MSKTRYWVSRGHVDELPSSGTDATRYAVQAMRPGHSFAIDFDLKGGTPSMDLSNIVARTGDAVGDWWRTATCKLGDCWFAGWEDALGERLTYLYNSTTEALRHVSARLVPPANVVFDAETNGGSLFRPSGLKYYEGKTYGAFPTAVGPSDAKRCVGWFRSPSGDGGEVFDYETCGGDETLYARYESYSDYFRPAINSDGNVEFDMDLAVGSWRADEDVRCALCEPQITQGFEVEQHGGFCGYDYEGNPAYTPFKASVFTMSVSGPGTLSFRMRAYPVYDSGHLGTVAVVVGNTYNPSPDGSETPNSRLFGTIASGMRYLGGDKYGVKTASEMEDFLMNAYPDGGYEHPMGDVAYMWTEHGIDEPFSIRFDDGGEHVMTVMLGGPSYAWTQIVGEIRYVSWNPDYPSK